MLFKWHYWPVAVRMLWCDGVGEDEETKKQKQKALIDAAFKVKSENTENNSSGGVDGNEESDDGVYSVVLLLAV